MSGSGGVRPASAEVRGARRALAQFFAECRPQSGLWLDAQRWARRVREAADNPA
jgi:hypothetical protein